VSKERPSFAPDLDGAGLRLAVVVARFNPGITRALYDGCRDELAQRGVDLESVEHVETPGCFELALVAKTLAASRRFDAIICLGAIIRGETPHFEYVSSAAATGIQRASLDTGVPVVFGVLTTDDEAQALDRAGGRSGHKGREAALTAIEMARTMERIRQGQGRRSDY